MGQHRVGCLGLRFRAPLARRAGGGTEGAREQSAAPPHSWGAPGRDALSLSAPTALLQGWKIAGELLAFSALHGVSFRHL